MTLKEWFATVLAVKILILAQGHWFLMGYCDLVVTLNTALEIHR
jgi:hypothetical protein